MITTDRPMGIEVTQAALLPCPLCGAPADEPREEQGHHNDGWWLVCCSSCDLQLPRNWSKEAAITAWNTRQSSIASPTYAEGRADVDYWNDVAAGLGHESVCEALEALERLQEPAASLTDAPDAVREALKFIDDFFAPWGSWKTAWWEGEVSDDAGFSADNALKHVANKLRSFAPSKVLPCDVTVHPATTFKAGVRVSTLLDCIEDRRTSSLTTPAAKDDAGRLPQDVVRLVIAAREIAFNDWDGDSEEWVIARKELDDASEAFASRVPWENE